MVRARYRANPQAAVNLIILLFFSTIVHTSPLTDPGQTGISQEQHGTTDLSSSIVEGRELRIPPLLLNTSTLVFHAFQQVHVASAPIISAIFTHIGHFTQESLIGGKPIADTFECSFGILEFAVVSLHHQVKVPWEAIQHIAQLLQERMRRGMVGFFRLTWEVITGIWVGVILGISETGDKNG